MWSAMAVEPDPEVWGWPMPDSGEFVSESTCSWFPCILGLVVVGLFWTVVLPVELVLGGGFVLSVLLRVVFLVLILYVLICFLMEDLYSTSMPVF